MQIESLQWKKNVPTAGIKAEDAYRALEKIRAEKDLTDDAIVESAKPKNHVLHKWFQWDDTTAAIEHRRAQARLLIRAFTVTYKEAPKLKSRAYQVLQKARRGDTVRTVYSTTEEVLNDPDARNTLIAQAIKAAMEFRDRFKHLHELQRIVEAIDQTLIQIGD